MAISLLTAIEERNILVQKYKLNLEKAILLRIIRTFHFFNGITPLKSVEKPYEYHVKNRVYHGHLRNQAMRFTPTC